mmetsp:Transcript_40620/g.63438  ORF Transcript_40620/g.63438 Transcript_40620/m.63438 type:complete len:211 (+) Transcript_40620:100-732(+)
MMNVKSFSLVAGVLVGIVVISQNLMSSPQPGGSGAWGNALLQKPAKAGQLASSFRVNKLNLDMGDEGDQPLKTYKVVVHPPPTCCPAKAGPSCCGGAAPAPAAPSDGGVQQVNMVGFTNHGMGYIEYGDQDGHNHVLGPNGRWNKKSTLRAQKKHRNNRIKTLQDKLQGAKKEIKVLDGEVWALTSDVIPRMQKELSSLKHRVSRGRVVQ